MPSILYHYKMIFYTSDTHFNHAAVIKYCNRPFLDVPMMNSVMIERWNRVVRPEDTVYHLGDFAMGQRELLKPIISQLNGYKILVRGNHDRSPTVMLEAGFNEVYKELILQTDAGLAYLHHQPMPESHWGGADFHLCGHIHDLWVTQGKTINVGVDVWDFTPRTIDELLTSLN